MANSKSKQGLSPSLTKQISFNEEVSGVGLTQKNAVRRWVIAAILSEGKTPGFISYTFCSDRALLKINQTYLHHNDYTDIITFDLSEGNILSGDIYISIDRVKDNARSLGTRRRDELHRVLIHGVLHLCGYEDKSPRDQHQMRQREDYYLSLFPQ